MKLLALDTSTEACSVALQYDGQQLTLDEVCPQQHSKRILPMVQQLLAESGLGLNQLDGIVFGRGPGSFTGVRIGVGVTQGLAFGADLPVFGVSTLQAMAQAAVRLHQAKQVIAAIDARMAEVYLALYQQGTDGLMQPVCDELARKPADLPALTLAGDIWAVGTGLVTYRDAFLQWAAATQLSISEQVLLPSAQDMLTLAVPAWQQQLFVAAELAEPVYVRDEVTWQKLPGR
ncbi:MAG: tRNA (adenosine(37)-N6)-threonylcarbamoyltransferase complex dimerization subunit type 1 TsaB [Rheinheimera sp.]|nr:MAG: tRNA (adenosine(37)-N6)-threonylcarbamoyltransferase complex dimerization subunit type 1 TsaB [Rheinheimera sp.]